jgi:hypothetical protein
MGNEQGHRSSVRAHPSIYTRERDGSYFGPRTVDTDMRMHRRDSYGIKHAAACAGVQCAASTVLHPPSAYVPAMQSYVQCMA